MAEQRPTIIVIGAGFAGLNAAKQFAKAEVDVLLVDRHNFHLFTPLLYQVATSGLEPGEIAYPVRGIIQNLPNVRFLMGRVTAIDTDAKVVTVRSSDTVICEHYDYLIVAAGSESHYFGMEQVERYAFGLKTLSDGVLLRNHILTCFEHAAWIDDPERQAALTTMVVVGGGPTGLETAGALRELYHWVLSKEFKAQLGDQPGRVILVEMLDHLLAPYPPKLRQSAHKQLESLGVEVRIGRKVVEAAEDHITLDSGEVIPTYTLVWSAGVKPSPVAELLGVELHESGAVPVRPTMEMIGCEDVYVVGDMAYLENKQGERYPMLIPIAKQQGVLAAKNILRRMEQQPQQPLHFTWLSDRGIMATIGRSRAVAWIFYKIQLSGFIAWLAWLGLHLVTLLGVRNRLNVFVNWVWNYLTYDRSVRLILQHEPRGLLVTEPGLRPDADEVVEAVGECEEAPEPEMPLPV